MQNDQLECNCKSVYGVEDDDVCDNDYANHR